jgi:hypothetical protein
VGSWQLGAEINKPIREGNLGKLNNAAQTILLDVLCTCTDGSKLKKLLFWHIIYRSEFMVEYFKYFGEAGIAQLGEQQTEASGVFWRSRVQSTVLAFFTKFRLCCRIRRAEQVQHGALAVHFGRISAFDQVMLYVCYCQTRHIYRITQDCWLTLQSSNIFSCP